MVCGQKDGQKVVGKIRNDGETWRGLMYTHKERTAMQENPHG